MKSIGLDRTSITKAVSRLRPGLEKYTWLQEELRRRDVSTDPLYKRRFNGFYRVRRNPEWQRIFFALLQRGKNEPPSLREIVEILHSKTGRIEASFVTKLLATLDPSQPVIDAVVLRNLGLRLPTGPNTAERIRTVCDLHAQLSKLFSDYLRSKNGRFLVDTFRRAYPSARLTEVKMLDLVLWQTRPA